MKTAQLIRERNVISASFPLNHDLLFTLREFSHTKITNCLWEFEITKELVSTLKELGFQFSKPLETWYKDHTTYSDFQRSHEIYNENLVLYPFQKEGVRFIETHNGRALIADEMGLGKTVQAISWLKKHQEFRPVLVICPASVKIQWQNEIKRWMNADAEILNGTLPYAIKKEIVIINYDILSYWQEEIMYVHFDVVIVDEAQKIKSNKAKRTKAFKKIVKDTKKIVALTGTPIENRPVEIYNIVQCINPYIFPNFIKFAEEYCGAKRGRFGWDFSGSTNMIKLNAILKNTIMIRRKKDEVLQELPPKQIVKVSMEIDNRQEYQKAEEQFILFLQEKLNRVLDDELVSELKDYAKRKGIKVSEELSETEITLLKMEKLRSSTTAPILSQIEILKQLSIQGKINQITDWIETFLESGEKLVVFAIHTKTIDYLMKQFPTAVKIDGSVSQKQRQNAVDKFQHDPDTRLFVGNIHAAGIGITLTAASNAAIIEFPWSPGELVQASDRIHRITQTKQVTIWNLVGAETIEERIIDLLKIKENVINHVLDGKAYEDKSILMGLIESYRKIKKYEK